MSGMELAEDICSRLDDILIEESPMHPFGCATWEESSRIAIDMAKDAIRRAAPMEAVAWREALEKIASPNQPPRVGFDYARQIAIQALALIPQGAEAPATTELSKNIGELNTPETQGAEDQETVK